MTKKVELQAVDWSALLERLKALATKIPAIAALVLKILADLESGAGLKKATVTSATCNPDCRDCCCQFLEAQREELLNALVQNLCLEEHVCEWCSDDAA